MRPIYRLLIAVILFSTLSPVTAQVPSFLTDSIDAYVNRNLKAWKIPGVAVLVVKDTSVVLMKGYGSKMMEKDDAVNENTLFMIASNTKAFTGTAIAMLATQGLCSINDPVTKWLPGFSMKDPWKASHTTLTDVLTHRLGMETFQGDFMYWESDLTSDQVVEKFGKLEPVYDFRTKYGYCNAGFLIAGECIESITGKKWGQVISEMLLEQLEMKGTLVETSSIKRESNAARAHTLVEGELTEIPFCQIDNLAPAASISSSVNDMSHWLITLLNDGVYKNKQVISPEAIRMTRQPYTIIGRRGHPFNNKNYALYGLGWQLEDYEGREVVSHTGGVDGFVTSVALLPKEKLGVVVLTNTDANWFYESLKWDIIDAYLGLPYRNYSSMYLKRYEENAKKDAEQLASWRDSVDMKKGTPVPLAKFAGRYTHDVYGYAQIKAKKDYLEMTFEHHPGLEARLDYMGDNRFLCTYSNPLFGIKVFPFVIEGDMVKSFTLSVADFLEYTTYQFVKM